MIKPRELESDSGRDAWEMVTAAATGDTPTLRRLIDRDRSLIRSEYFYTPAIHFAVRDGHLEALEILLEAGADPAFRVFDPVESLSDCEIGWFLTDETR